MATRMSTPVLPDWVPRTDLTRPSAEQLTNAENRNQSLTYAGPNEVIPVVWGEQIVGGPIIAGPYVNGSQLVWAVAISWAGAYGIERIEDCRVGETISTFGAISNVNTGATASNSGVSVRVFDGRQTLPYSTLTSAIPGFDDDFHGIAYAILTCSVSGFSSLPQVTFRVKGRKCFDPRVASWEPFEFPIEPNDVLPFSPSSVLIGGDGGLAYTADVGAWAWAQQDVLFGESNILSVGLSGGNYIVVGEDGKVSSAADPVSAWTARISNVAPETIRAVSRIANTTTLLGGDNGAAATGASSGTSWTARSPAGLDDHNILAVAAPNNRYCVAGEGGFYMSGSSTTNWTVRDIGFGDAAIRQLIHMTGTAQNVNATYPLLALGDGGTVAYSVDGDNFEAVEAGFGTENIVKAVWADGYVFALGENGTIRYTASGRDWFGIPVLPNMRPVKLFYAHGWLYVLDSLGRARTIEVVKLVEGEFTENPVLHMRDFVTDPDIGMGSELYGFEAAADIADSLYSGIPRSRSGLAIQDPMTEEDALALFAQYAEVLWSYEGEGVRIIPDAPVDEVHPIPVEQIRQGSIRMYTVGLEQIPTEIRLMFTDRNDGGIWFSKPAVASVPEHEIAGLPTTPSSVPMPGVFNRLQAERMVYQRLQRLQTPGRIEWQMTAPGMKYQAGDVVRLPNVMGLQDIDVRLTSQPSMVSPMTYQMSGEIYRESNYPLGAEGIAVPEGALLIWRGGATLPIGWAAVNLGDRIIREGAPGNAGSSLTLSHSVSTTTAGAHVGTRSTEMVWQFVIEPDGSPFLTYPVPPYFYVGLSGTPSPTQGHSHSFSGSVAAEQTVPRRAFRWIRRVDPAALMAPGICFLGADDLTNLRVVESNVRNTFLSGSNNAQEKALAYNATVFRSLGHANHGHNEQEYGRRNNDPRSSTQHTRTVHMGQRTASPAHEAAIFFKSTLRSIAMAMFESLGDAALPEGAIVGWDTGTIPEGWALCDGTNGTVDLSERFIYIAAKESAGAEHGSENLCTISAHAGGWVPDHNHVTPYTGHTTDQPYRSPANNPYHNNSEGGHDHSVVTPGKTQAIDNILRYQLRFIQYIGS